MADDGVPPKYMLAVRDFTGGEVTLESLVQERSVGLDPLKATDPPKPAAPPAQDPDLSTTDLDKAGLVDRREIVRRSDDIAADAELKLLGGSISAAAEAIGISYQAIDKWPEELPQRIQDRVIAAIARKHLDPSLIGGDQTPFPPAQESPHG